MYEPRTFGQLLRDPKISFPFLGLWCMNLLAALDATALSVAIPVIADALDATNVQAYWAGTAFILGSAVLQPVFAALSDPFGRRPMATVALIVFAVGTIVCATAQTINTLLVGRTIQGIGGGGLLSLTYVVMGDLLDKAEMSMGLSFITIAWILGTACGPVMGGGFTDHASWRWIFWICLPIAGLSLILISGTLKTSHESPPLVQGLKETDWLGFVVSVIVMTSFLVAISWGGLMFSWTSWQTLVPLLLGAAGIFLWLLYEYLIPNIWRDQDVKPMLPPKTLRSLAAMIGSICTVLMGIVQFGILYYLPLYFEVSKGYSPLIAGVALIPICISSGFMTVIAAGSVKKRLGTSYVVIAWLGWAILALGCGLLALLSPSTSIPAWIFISIPSGIGVGCLFPGLMYSILAPQTKETKQTALALNPFLRALGQAFGIAIGNAIYQNAFKAYLQDSSRPLLRQEATNIAKNSAKLGIVLHGTTDASRERTELLAAFNKSLHVLWYALMGISLLAGLLSIGIAYRKHSLGSPASRATTTTPTSEQAVRRDTDDTDGYSMVDLRAEVPTRDPFATPTNPFATESRLSNYTT